MKERLSSAWIVAITLILLITAELLGWMIYGAIPALILGLIVTQIGMALFTVWLALRQRRHAAQTQRSFKQSAVRMERSLRAVNELVTTLRENMSATDSYIRTRDDSFHKILELNTTEIRRLAQLPSSSEPHPIEIRLLDELAEARMALNKLYSQVRNLEDDWENAKYKSDEAKKDPNK